MIYAKKQLILYLKENSWKSYTQQIWKTYTTTKNTGFYNMDEIFHEYIKIHNNFF